MKRRHKRPEKWPDCNHDQADAIDVTNQLRDAAPQFMAALDKLAQDLDPAWQAHRARVRHLHTVYPRKWKQP
jgi:hypothetical protein